MAFRLDRPGAAAIGFAIARSNRNAYHVVIAGVFLPPGFQYSRESCDSRRIL